MNTANRLFSNRAPSSTSPRSCSTLRLQTIHTEDTIIPAFLAPQNTVVYLCFFMVGNQWQLYWNLVCQKRAWVQRMLALSAVDAPNRGSVFSFEEFKVLVTTGYDPAKGVPFAVVIQKRFMAITLLLGALRTEQFSRFRKGGLEAIEWLHDNKDEDHRQQTHTHTQPETVGGDGYLTPMATSCYARVKNRNGSSPDATDDTFFLTVACLCAKHHQPIRTPVIIKKRKALLSNQKLQKIRNEKMKILLKNALIKVCLDVTGQPKGPECF